MSFPTISTAQVIDVDAARGYVYISLPSTQVVGLRARMLYHGPADGLRIKQSAMPTVGTMGVVVFPYGESRNGIWMGSILHTMLDARTGDTDPYTEYESHWSGAFEHMDGFGNYHKYFPDGTYMSFAESTALPAVTRHTVDANQKQIQTAYAASERTASAVAARPVLLNHASGTQVSIDAAGDVNVTVAAGKTATIAANGGTFLMDASGNITLTGVAMITLNAPAIELNGTITQGTGTSGTAASFIGPLTVTNDVTAGTVSVKNHVHSGVTTGSGDTAAPVPGT